MRSEISLRHEPKLGKLRDLGDALLKCTPHPNQKTHKCLECYLTSSMVGVTVSTWQEITVQKWALQLWLMISILTAMASHTNNKDGGSEGTCLLWTLHVHG